MERTSPRGTSVESDTFSSLLRKQCASPVLNFLSNIATCRNFTDRNLITPRLYRAARTVFVYRARCCLFYVSRNEFDEYVTSGEKQKKKISIVVIIYRRRFFIQKYIKSAQCRFFVGGLVVGKNPLQTLGFERRAFAALLDRVHRTMFGSILPGNGASLGKSLFHVFESFLNDEFFPPRRFANGR